MSENQYDTRGVNKLKNQLKNQGETVSKMRHRISSLSDEIATLRSEVEYFKKYVTDDMQRLVEKIEAK